MKTIIKGKSLVGGRTEGTLIVSHEPFSFFGGFSFKTGSIVDTRSDVYQEVLKDKIFAFPCGKGSSSTAGVILEALRKGIAPRAIININSEKILAIGSIVAEKMYGLNLPIISISEDDYQLLKTGLFLRINNEIIEVM